MSVKLINIEVYSDLTRAMGSEFVSELASTFLDDVPKLLEVLKQAAETNDARVYKQTAGLIRSKAGVFGATVLANLARDIELAGLTDPDAYIPELETTYDDTALALKTLIKS